MKPKNIEEFNEMIAKMGNHQIDPVIDLSEMEIGLTSEHLNRLADTISENSSITELHLGKIDLSKNGVEALKKLRNSIAKQGMVTIINAEKVLKLFDKEKQGEVFTELTALIKAASMNKQRLKEKSNKIDKDFKK